MSYFPVDLLPPEPKQRYHDKSCHWCLGEGKEPIKPDWVKALENTLIYFILASAAWLVLIYIMVHK